MYQFAFNVFGAIVTLSFVPFQLEPTSDCAEAITDYTAALSSGDVS